MLAKFKKNKKRFVYKEIIFSLLVVIAFIALIGFLISANYRISKKRNQYLSRIKILEEEIQKAEKKKEELEKGVSQAASKEHLEKIAREQFGMKSPGEEVVVISKEEPLATEEEGEGQESFWDPQRWWDWLTGKR